MSETQTIASIQRSDAKFLLTELGSKNCSGFTDEKLLNALVNRIPKLIGTPDLNNPTSERGRNIFQSYLVALDEKAEIQIVDDEPGTELPVVQESNGHAEDEPATPKKSRAPVQKKGPTEEEKEALLAHFKEIEGTINRKFAFKEMEPPKLLKVTKALAEEFKDMEVFPRDRDISESRLNYHRDAMNNMEFRGPEWISCFVEENAKTYRLNGKHTSFVLMERFEAGNPYECRALVRRYSCPTLEDAAHLYATIDARQSARSKADVVRGFAATQASIAALPPRILSVLTSGIAYSLLEGTYRKLSPVEQSGLLVQDSVFAGWAGEMINGKSKEELSNWKHMVRMSVVAAMRLTWLADATKAEDFWLAIRDDSNDPLESPRRTLHKKLSTSKVGGRDASERTGEREMFLMCLKAWNWWITGEKPGRGLAYRKDEKTPEVKKP